MLGYGIIGSIVIGAAAGYIAGHLTKGSGFGCWLNTVIGIVGGWLGGWLFSLIGGIPDTFSIIGSLVVAVLGSLLLLWLVSNQVKLLLFKRPKAEHPYPPASLAEHGISCVEVEPSFFSAISSLKAAKAVDAHCVDAVLVCRYADAMAAVSARKLARRPFKIIYLAQANSPAPDRCLLAIRAQIDGWIFQSERLRSLYPADLADCAVIHPAPAQIDLPGLAPCDNARLWVGPIDGNAQRLRQAVEEACASGGAARLVVCGTGKASEVMPIVRRSRLAPDAVEWLGAEYDLAAQASKAACVVQAGLDPTPLELALAASGLPLVSPAGIQAHASGQIGHAAEYIKKFR